MVVVLVLLGLLNARALIEAAAGRKHGRDFVVRAANTPAQHGVIHHVAHTKRFWLLAREQLAQSWAWG